MNTLEAMPPPSQSGNYNGYRFCAAGITHAKRSGKVFDWEQWCRSLDAALNLPKDDAAFKISLIGIWDNQMKQWINLDLAPAQ